MLVADYRGLDKPDRLMALLTQFAVTRARIGMTPREYQEIFGVERRTFYRDIERLEFWGCQFEVENAPAGRRVVESEVRYRLEPGHPVAGWMVKVARPVRIRRRVLRDPLPEALPLFELPAVRRRIMAATFGGFKFAAALRRHRLAESRCVMALVFGQLAHAAAAARDAAPAEKATVYHGAACA